MRVVRAANRAAAEVGSESGVGAAGTSKCQAFAPRRVVLRRSAEAPPATRPARRHWDSEMDTIKA